MNDAVTRILLAIAFDPPSEAVVAPAGTIADRLGAQLTVLHASSIDVLKECRQPVLFVPPVTTGV